jgi:hypothetical protein
MSLDQQIDNAESLGIRQVREMQQTNPELVIGIALENLQQELIANERQRQMDMRPDATPSDVIGQTYNEVSSMLGGAGQPSELQQPPMVAEGISQPPMVAEGIPQLPAQNMAMGAQGGIVGYAEGGLNEDEEPKENRMQLSDVDNYINQYKNYQASLAAATTPEDKALVTSRWKEVQGSFHMNTVAEAHQKMSAENQSGMAGGGIVSLQGGGGVKSYQGAAGSVVTADGPTYPPPPRRDPTTGEYSFFVFDNNGIEVQVEEEEYYRWVDLYDQRNRRDFPESFEPTPAPDLTPGQIAQKRSDQLDQNIGPIIGGETGLIQDLKNVGSDPNLENWQQRAGGGLEAALEAVSKFGTKFGGQALSGLEYLARSLGEGGKGFGQTGVVPEAIEAIQGVMYPGINQGAEVVGEAVSEAAQNVAERASAFELDWLNKDKVKALAQRFGMTSDEEKEAERIEGLNTAAQAELGANAEAAAPVDSEEGALSYLQGVGQQQEARGDFDVGGRHYREPPPVPGEEQEKRNWLDKTMSVLELLGQAGGASKGYEFAQINEREAAQRALTEANEFDMAKQQAVLNQRTEERNMILDMQAKIARADALAEINETLHQRVLSDPARESYKEAMIKESKGNRWIPFQYDEVWVDSKMADWDIAKFQELQQQAMEPIDASLGTGTTPPAVNTAGFGQLRVN